MEFLIKNKFKKITLFKMLILLAFFVVATLNNNVACYNLSPKANIIIKDPQLPSNMPKVDSSYFGYSLSLRPAGIIVGAPRAQSTLPMQRNINETGAIYRCSLIDKTCYPYVFSDKGNRFIEANEYTYDNEMRDYQWLGAAMDGGPHDSDKLVVCAPRFIAPTALDYLMHGICYWVNDTLAKDPQKVQKLSPLRLKFDQIKEVDGHRYYYYMYGEMGLSAHITANNEEFLIGAPGIHTWKGSLVRYRKKTLTDDPSLSRRDLSGGRVTRQSDVQPSRESYDPEVLQPEKWKQPNDSYFGYSVTSGYFDSMNRKKLMYVATAPQANLQSGEAYLFDIGQKSINKHYVFRGLQFGEYFGYAALAEDLNGDGLTDVIVSAPQHSISGSFDDGAIYVFINLGNYNFEKTLVTSPIHGKVRFGTTLTQLGDINHDGFNDIAVGAPFAGDGSVFIYLGSEKGLREQHSQRLDSPKGVQSKYGTLMFGHGLSKGSDIDNNEFNDFAIGAPNAESIFVYRAYPVVKVRASISSQTRELKSDQNKFQITACYGISTTSTKVRNQDLAIQIVVDPQVKRVRIPQTNSNEVSFNVSAGLQQQCRILDCEVRFSVADIFKPIEMEMHYQLIHNIPDSEVFCETCAAVDPTEPKVTVERIIFSTGCATDICIADLQVRSRVSKSYTLGSARALNVIYDITNIGESAYLPQINVTSSNRMPFARIPPNCKLNEKDMVLICDLNGGQPMAKGSKDDISISYDVSGISGSSMILTAEVFSTGKESTSDNNKVKDVITLNEFTEVDVIGLPQTQHINLEKSSGTSRIINNYEIKSNGPSTVGALEVVFHIPIAYRVTGSSALINVININNITMQAVYDAQLIGIDYYQNNTLLIMGTIETSSSSSSSSSSSVVKKVSKVSIDNANSIHYDSVKMGHFDEMEHSLSDSVMTATMSHQRRRRDAAMHTATKEQYAHIKHMKAHDLLDEKQKDTLPVNRTIVFNCNDPERTVCVRAVMRVYNFKPEKPITVVMKYSVDLNEINQILIEPWEYFVVLMGLDVNRVGGNMEGKSVVVNRKIEYNIISKHQLPGTPIWIIIVSILGGLLLLALITYGMYKKGFFKRQTKEEMDKLISQNHGAPAGESEIANLNTDQHNN